MNRRQLRKLHDSIPKGDPNGLWWRNSETGEEVFLSFDDLHYLCRDLMDPINAPAVEAELGKMHWSKDPTYNLRKK